MQTTQARRGQAPVRPRRACLGAIAALVAGLRRSRGRFAKDQGAELTSESEEVSFKNPAPKPMVVSTSLARSVLFSLSRQQGPKHTRFEGPRGRLLGASSLLSRRSYACSRRWTSSDPFSSRLRGLGGLGPLKQKSPFQNAPVQDVQEEGRDPKAREGRGTAPPPLCAHSRCCRC